MSSTSSEILITLIGGSLLFIFLVVIIIVAIVRYQIKSRTHLLEVERLKHESEQEMLKARLEVQNKTLTDISREIHDNIGQILSVANLSLNSLRASTPDRAASIQDISGLIHRAVADLRSLSRMMNADYIGSQNLSELIIREVETINRAGKMTFGFQLEGDEVGIDSSRQLVLFRIIQECMQNAIKHSSASTVQVHLLFKDHHLTILVSDDGVGFDVNAKHAGTGLINLRTRAQLVKAVFECTSIPGKGTRISLRSPV